MENRNALKVMILAMCFWAMVFSSVAFGGDVYDYAVYVRETRTQIIYYGTVAFGTADSSDNHYTQYFQIDDCNSEHAFFWGYCAAEGGTEDVVVYAHYSSNLDTSIVGANNSGKIIDSLYVTLQSDTIDVYNGTTEAYFEGTRFMRFNFDGTANQTTVYWWAVFKKNDPEVGAIARVYDHN